MLTSATFPVKAAVSAKLGTVTPFTPTYQPCPKEGTVRLVVRSVHLPLCGRLWYLCLHAIPFPQVLYGPRLTPNEQITAEMMGCHFWAWVTGCGFPLGHPFCLSHLPTLLWGKRAAMLWAAYESPCGEELLPLASSLWGPESCQQPRAWTWMQIPPLLSPETTMSDTSTAALWRTLSQRSQLSRARILYSQKLQ